MAYKWGMDTSEHQRSKVDYVKAKESGASFVFLRIGYNKRLDYSFEADYAAIKAAGLAVGVYFYTMSTTEAAAKADATRVLGWLKGRELDLPVVYDVEDKVQQGAARRVANSRMYNGFASMVKAEGYRTMLYTGEYFFNAYFYKDSIKDPLWIAKYSSREPNVGRQVSIWQFTSAKVSEPYYKGDLDRNYMLVDVSGEESFYIPPASTNPYPIPTRLLKRTWPIMMSGNDVKWLQYELVGRGYDTGGVDGRFGDKTLEAVKGYQGAHGLVVDGKVGPATRWSLISKGVS